MAILRASSIEYHDANAYRVVSWPTGAQAGDLAVAVIGNRYLPSMPAGWSTTHVVSGINQSGRIAWKILTGADIGGGTYTYVLAGTGTGSVATLVFAAGTFNQANPIADYVDSIAPDVNEFMAYLAINTSQTVYHYATARTTAAGDVFSSDGVFISRIDTAPDVEAALYADTASSETTKHTVWTATAASTGSYKASFIVADPVGAVAFPGLSSPAAVMLVASYAASAVSPADGEVVDRSDPVLTVYADGAPSPFQVQFQTSSSTSFSSTSWSTTLTGRTKGLVSATVGVALPDKAVTYWRARAGDGTTWGPWSATRALRVELALSWGVEYVYESVGFGDTLVGDAAEYVYDNAGLAATPVDTAIDYVHENVGFLATPKDLGVEYLYDYVYVGIPAPHLWFVYKTYGFANDHIWIYGQGLGTLQNQYHAQPKLDYGPDFTAADINPAVFDWSVSAAATHAYDDQRRIYPGADSAPPIVNVECDIVELIVPAGAVADTVQNDFWYVITDGGPSNRLPFLLYPLIDVPMAISAGDNVSGTAVRLTGQLADEVVIPQHYSTFDLTGSYVISSSFAERPPRFLTTASSAFSLTGGEPTTALDDPVDISVPLSKRWRPLDSAIVPRSDLGTGVSVWTPQEGGTPGWKMYADSAPYVDAENTLDSRNGEIVRPALVFPGDAALELTDAVPSGPSFALVLALQLHATGNQSTTILSSFNTTPDPDSYPILLEQQGDKLSLKIGAGMASIQLPSTWLGHRAIVLGLMSDGLHGVFAAAADKRYLRKFVHKKTGSSGLKLYLGRTNDPLPQPNQPRMQILDMAYKGGFPSINDMMATVNAFDSAYGGTP